MSIQAACAAIRSRFVDEVESEIGLPVQYDNAPFTKPANGGWVSFAISFTTSRQMDVGGQQTTYRDRGIAIALVHNLVGSGDRANLLVAKAIVNALRGVTAQGVKYLPPVSRVLGRVGKEWRTEVSCPFYMDDLV